MLDKDQEYRVSNELNQVIMKKIEEKLDDFYDVLKDDFKGMIAYPLIVLENANNKMSMESIQSGFDIGDLLNLLNPLREATYWYIREMLKRQGKITAVDVYYDVEQPEFGNAFCETVLELHQTYLHGKQIGLHRGMEKVKYNEVSANKYEILFPKVNEEYNKELLYYYGLDDALQSEHEKEIVIKVDKYLFEMFNVEKLARFPERIFEYLKRAKDMELHIDSKLYRLCKRRVAIDVNKISEEIESMVISNKKELIDVLAIFYYLSRICMHKYMLETLVPYYIKNHRKIYCEYSKIELEELAKQVGIYKDTLNRYIEYFSMNVNIEKGGFGEFPLLLFGEKVIWIPSSILLNDFQFSIVNGHYYKNIIFPKHEETIAKSIVDYIIKNVSFYDNIIYASNYVYSEVDKEYNGKKLQSDIDVALYDVDRNTLLIIECKWKENVYAFTDDYLKVERAVNEVYRTQLDKHKFYLSLCPQNYNKIFENKVDIAEKIESLQVMYLFVDKRIQFHIKEENRHVISTFMLAYFFKKYAKENKLNLRELIYEIQNQKSEAQYKRIPLAENIKIGDKVFV